MACYIRHTVRSAGKFFTLAASLVVGLIIAGYIQGNVLNGLVELGALTGETIRWHEFIGYMLLGVAIWLVLLALPLAMRLFASLLAWKRSVMIVCVLLTGMQAVALVSSIITSDKGLWYVPEHYLAREGTYEVSRDSNIIVFVLDGLNYEYIEAVRESDPAFFDKLDGFTEFINAAGEFPNTFPAGTFMTTGIAYDFIMTRTEYFDYAWGNSEFIKTLQDGEYKLKYHMSDGYMFSNFEQIIDIAENVKSGAIKTRLLSVVKNLGLLSAYRHAPMALKPALWMPVVVFTTTQDISREDIVYIYSNDHFFMELLARDGLSVQSEGSNYAYLHLYGSHPPYTLSEDAQFVQQSNMVSQTKGAFNIVFHYMDEMKRLGIYEDATIAILADHGLDTAHIGYFIKPKGVASVPLEQNNAPVSLANLLPAILQSEGMNYSFLEESAFDLEEDSPGERYIYRYVGTTAVEVYKVVGHIRDRANWELIDSREFLLTDKGALPAE